MEYKNKTQKTRCTGCYFSIKIGSDTYDDYINVGILFVVPEFNVVILKLTKENKLIDVLLRCDAPSCAGNIKKKIRNYIKLIRNDICKKKFLKKLSDMKDQYGFWKFGKIRQTGVFFYDNIEDEANYWFNMFVLSEWQFCKKLCKRH
ncbi:MAG: hypothetical protein WC445_04715 [Patescibacteria group bacterium]